MSLIKFSDSVSDLLPISLMTAGVKHNQEARSRPKGAHFHHIFYVEKGEGIFEISGKKTVFGEGTALFIRKNCPVSYQKNGDVFETAWVTFDGPFADNTLSYFDACDFEFIQSKNIYPLISECHKQLLRGASPARLSALVYNLTVTFFTELHSNGKSPAVLYARRYVDENYASDISVGDIADAAGISSSLLFRLFREEEDMTPAEYLRGVRIKKAQLLLISSPEMKIYDVAASCGFADTAYFCKVFGKHTGITPKAYRSRFSV